ncbi:MAG: response regulator transcription factor [Gemmatimonadota bacterium]
MNLRIVLADDHEIVREGLRVLLSQQSGMEVVAEADSGLTAVELARQHQPDVVVMDIGMADLNGIEATRRIKSELPDIKVIALSMHADKRFVAGMLQAGASGYLLKKGAFHELAQAVREVMAGRLYLSPKIADVVIHEYVQHLSDQPAAGKATLTAREREVLQLLVEGKSAEQIAEVLHVSINTVGTHRHRIMEKLDIHSLPELTKYAIREGLTFLES